METFLVLFSKTQRLSPHDKFYTMIRSCRSFGRGLIIGYMKADSYQPSAVNIFLLITDYSQIRWLSCLFVAGSMTMLRPAMPVIGI